MIQLKQRILSDCMELQYDQFQDHRGISIKPFQKMQLQKLGIHDIFEEDLIVWHHKNVLKGMHFQTPPYGQAKLLYCLQGNIMDVVLDLRKDSAFYGQAASINLSAQERNILYVPPGFAHGFLVLAEGTVVVYKLSNQYYPEMEDGILWNSFGMDWGITHPILSEKDKQWSTWSAYCTR